METTVQRDSLLEKIEAFLTEHGMTKSEFGVSAVNSSTLVETLRDGRIMYPSTRKRVQGFMDAYNAQEVERDYDALCIVKRCGFVFLSTAGEPCLESHTQITRHRFLRLVRAGMLTPQGDGLMDGISQPTCPHEEDKVALSTAWDRTW